jgi:hypothetical protein
MSLGSELSLLSLRLRLVKFVKHRKSDGSTVSDMPPS